MTAQYLTDVKFNTLVLLITEKPKLFNAVDVSKLYANVMHDKVNWHEFSTILDLFRIMNLIKLNHINADGMCCYRMS